MSLRDVLRIPAAEITDEAVYRDRRRLLAALALAPGLGLAGCSDAAPPPSKAVVTPEQARSGFRTSETLTRFEDVATYNNFYEFGTGKADPSRAERTLRLKPWSVAVGGQCAKPGVLSLDDLLKGLVPEERIYRLRCVEGWSMVIPWLGVPLASVLKRFEPTSRAKYVAFTTLHDPKQMPGQSYGSLDWPYREGLRIDEAMHPLTFLVTGLYGKPLPQQNGGWNFEIFKMIQDFVPDVPKYKSRLKGVGTCGTKVPDIDRELKFHRDLGNAVVLDETIESGGEKLRLPLVRMADKFIHVLDKAVYEDALGEVIPYGICHLVYVSTNFEQDVEVAKKAGARMIGQVAHITAQFGEPMVAFFGPRAGGTSSS